MMSQFIGVACIKPEYIVPEAKKAKFDEMTAAVDGIKKGGQNKHRHQKYDSISEPKLCSSVKNGDSGKCSYPACRFLHSSEEYLKLKPPDVSNRCHILETQGYCPWGITCRFFSGHDGKHDVKEPIICKELLTKQLQVDLRKRNYDFSKANKATQTVLNSSKNVEDEENTANQANNASEFLNNENLAVDLNPREKKVIDFRGKLYLSPLTTLGNLPFRRICKEFGADITCGEMAMATNILQGQQSEWALLRRHPSEDCFGVQLCGNSPHLLGRSAQLIEDVGAADFIDLNLGCPIEIVYEKGSGSGLLRREKNLRNVVRSMVLATSLPVTVKTRTGIYDGKRVALGLMPMFKSSGVALITVHGRTREQRYTKYADWDYIGECAQVASPVPVFGNGDILSYEDYNAALEYNISGVMIGRGALYKPWIFKEIKEKKDWDISSSERLSILQRFVSYGFEHWGSDTRGVETTRRFLLEWLSFLYRYIPVGLLATPPQKINERPPQYCGRDDLETLMASPNCADWVKISEMLCGPVPENFNFVPKHKANSWAN